MKKQVFKWLLPVLGEYLYDYLEELEIKKPTKTLDKVFSEKSKNTVVEGAMLYHNKLEAYKKMKKAYYENQN